MASQPTCGRCKSRLPEGKGNGRPRQYCSDACRKAAYRRRLARPGKAVRSDWRTPVDLARDVAHRWDLGLDAAACESSTLVEGNWFGPTHSDRERRNALAFSDWADFTPAGSVVWLNPPYEPRVIVRFLEVAHATAKAGVSVIALVPASTGAKWWHEKVLGVGAEVEYLRGRLTFWGPHSSGGPAPWPSALVIYRSEVHS